MVDLSTTFPLVGSLTGSRIRVDNSGSRNSSGASPTKASRFWVKVLVNYKIEISVSY